MAQLAERTHASESTVRRRLDCLITTGHLRTVCIVDAPLCGYRLDANLAMSLPPSAIDTVGHALAGNPAIHSLFATTGSTDLQAAIFCRNRTDLYRFMTHTLGPLD